MAACATAECKAVGLCFPRSGHCVEDEHFMVRHSTVVRVSTSWCAMAL